MVAPRAAHASAFILCIGEVAGRSRSARSSQAAVVSSPGRTGSPAPPSRIVGVLLSGRRALALRPREADRDPGHPEQHGGGELRVAAHQPRQARRCQRSAPPQRARGAASLATARFHPPPEGRAAPPATAGRRSGFWEFSVCRQRAPAGLFVRGSRYVFPSNNLCSFLFGISF